MPARTTPLVNGEIYHIYNRGVEKRRIFDNQKCYYRFLKTVRYYQIYGPKPKFSNSWGPKIHEIDPDRKIVDILAYCLMPNHFHFLVKQLRDGGISEFVRKLADSYTKYYNLKFKRVGPLLQGRFKAVLIESDEQLVHVSRYIHLNPVVSFLINDLEQYHWSSYKEYISDSKLGFCAKEEVLNFFRSPNDYKQFVLDQVDYGKSLEIAKHQLIDIEES